MIWSLNIFFFSEWRKIPLTFALLSIWSERNCIRAWMVFFVDEFSLRLWHLSALVYDGSCRSLRYFNSWPNNMWVFAVAQFAQFRVWSAAGELLGAWLALAPGSGLLLAWACSAGDPRAEQEPAEVKGCQCSQPTGRAGCHSLSGLWGEKGDVSAQLTLWEQSRLSLRWELPAAEQCGPHTCFLMFAEV